jgi:hypothetical protein
MPRSSRLLRFSTAMALFGALGLGACKKSGDSAGPLATGGDPSTRAPSGGGVVLRYKSGPAKIKEDLKVTFTGSGGGQGGEMKADITGLLDLSDAGTDKLKLAFSILDVRQFELTGGMKPTPKDGKPVPDLAAKLKEAKGARIIDMLGDTDKAATKALPENAPKKEGEPVDELDMSSFGSFLGLPSELPKEGLVAGTPVKVSKEEKENVFGLEIDMETETTYTLVKIDDSSGKRLAEIKIESESSGAKEMNQGSKSIMLSLDVTSESTLVFNLDDQLPVSNSLQSTQNFSAGSEGGGEFRVVLDATYAPA